MDNESEIEKDGKPNKIRMEEQMPDGKQFWRELKRIIEEEESDFRLLEHLATVGPLEAEDSKTQQYLRRFFRAGTFDDAFDSKKKRKKLKSASEAKIRQLESLPSLDAELRQGSLSQPEELSPEDEKILELWQLVSRKFEIVEGNEGLDDLFFNRYYVSGTGKNTYYRRRISLGMVVTREQLPEDLKIFISECADAYALGRENAACAIARTSLERAMLHICQAKHLEGVKDYYIQYPPWYIRDAVTDGERFSEGEESLRSVIKNLYNKFSDIIHGRMLVGKDANMLINKTFKAIERLYDIHYPLAG